MSVLFGEWNIDGKPVDQRMLSSADAMLAPYAPDAISRYQGDGIVLSYHAFYTTAESHREQQPFISVSGAIISWDGRLDNREELARELGNTLTNKATDVEIVATAFDRWSTACFPKLLGDWAVAIWDRRQRQLILAKDFAGIRPLYYSVERTQVKWSSVVDPLVTLAGKPFQFNKEYAAGWLAMYPAADITPYVGIRGVPPGSLVVVNSNEVTTVKYWDFNPDERIRYRTDSEYEEHFRSAFRQAVRRRLRSDQPICCELSGGMDSPSITCMADLIHRSDPGIPDIYTLSFFDDTEPHADERPYFSKVEEKLGRSGRHVDTSGMKVFEFEDDGRFIAFPGGLSGRTDSFRSMYRHYFESNGIRVVLSGIGGDEVTGGVPSPTSELQDLFVQWHFRHLAHKLKLWALAKRKPWFYLAWEALSGFVPPRLIPQPKHLRPAPWLSSDFVRRYAVALSGFNRRLLLRESLPSYQANLDALEVVRRQLATMAQPHGYPYEKRYPFLDRTLLEFLFAVPREQILRPGYRRCLLRRALKDIVPSEVLDRRRKAYATRGPRVAITQEWNHVSGLCHNMICSRLHILSEQAFSNALITSKNDDQSPLVHLMRTIVLEAWLRNVTQQGVMAGPELDSIMNQSATQGGSLTYVVHETTAR